MGKKKVVNKDAAVPFEDILKGPLGYGEEALLAEASGHLHAASRNADLVIGDIVHDAADRRRFLLKAREGALRAATCLGNLLKEKR